MKVLVNSVTPKVGKSGKAYQTVVYNNNQQTSAFEEDFLLYVNKEVDVALETKGQYTNIRLLGGVASTPSLPPTPQKQSCGCDDEFGVRKSAMLLNIEMFKASGVTIDGPKFWSVLKDVEVYLQNGNTPGQV